MPVHHEGNAVDSQLIPMSTQVLTIPGRTSSATDELVINQIDLMQRLFKFTTYLFGFLKKKQVFLAARLPPIGSKSYHIERATKNRRRHSFKSKSHRLVPGEDHIITSDVIINKKNLI